MAKKRFVGYGGSMNPPTLAHEAGARQLAAAFDRCRVLPCGPRRDKRGTDAVDVTHRANMARIAFGHLPLELDLSDLERPSFLTAFELDHQWKRELGARWEVWHAIGSDIISGGANANSEIHRIWHEGRAVWNTLNFAVMPRPGFPIVQADLPPRHIVLPELNQSEASHLARRAFSRGQPESAGVSPEIAAYVTSYGLYSGRSAHDVKNG